MIETYGEGGDLPVMSGDSLAIDEREYAALKAWCVLMNAYLEDAPKQQKSQLLKEWQQAEQQAVGTQAPPVRDLTPASD